MALTNYKLIERVYTNPYNFTNGIISHEIAIAEHVSILQDYCENVLKKKYGEPDEVEINMLYYVIEHTSTEILQTPKIINMTNTQYITLSIILFLWMILTFILSLTVVGWVVLLPQMNDTRYYKSPKELRSSWMRIGVEIKDKLLFNK